MRLRTVSVTPFSIIICRRKEGKGVESLKLHNAMYNKTQLKIS